MLSTQTHITKTEDSSVAGPSYTLAMAARLREREIKMPRKNDLEIVWSIKNITMLVFFFYCFWLILFKILGRIKVIK